MIDTNIILILIAATLVFLAVIAGGVYALYRLYRYLERKKSQ